MQRSLLCNPVRAALLLATVAAVGGCTLHSARSLGDAKAFSASSPRITSSFDADWKFEKSDADGLQQPSVGDADWQSVNLPHDWSIQGPFDRSNPSGGSGAFLPDGVGWYRKHFTLPASAASRRVFVTFDGVMANSDVWINGFHLGHRPYGYVSFQYDLTGHLNFDGQENVLAVRADNSQEPASRWYSGAGIYRNVHLTITEPVHLTSAGTFVTTPKISSDAATVHVQNEITNQSDTPHTITVKVHLLDPAGKEVAVGGSTPLTVAPNATETTSQDFSVSAPQLWNLDKPALYQAISEVQSDGKTLDSAVTSFGIRDAEFKADTGFWLNGVNMKLKGVCLHGDVGAFGTAVPRGAWQHRLAALKAIGCNAIRTAHNPPDPEFLDLCDRMGFLVMDEMFDCWTVGKSKYDYHLYFKDWYITDTRDTVRRDRNHPCIILYSAGNEIHDTPHPDVAIPILRALVQTFHENDPSRPVTQALFRPNVSHDYTDGLADLLDVVGTNYRDAELLKAHEDKPSRKIVGTENGHTLQAWLAVRDNACYSGQFLWTGADYLGESRRWPTVIAGAGMIDFTDEARPVGRQRQSWWSDKPMVSIARALGQIPTGYQPGEPQVRARQAGDWTPVSLDPHPENVVIYSNCDDVELFLNGRSLGSKPRPADDSPRAWTVTFEPGDIKAIGKSHGETVATCEYHTAGSPAKLVLTTNHAALTPDWNDVSYVTATVLDAHNIPVPGATNDITFHLAGPAHLAGLETGNTQDTTPFQLDHRHAFEGRCVALVQATAPGEMTLTATAPGLDTATLTLHARQK